MAASSGDYRPLLRGGLWLAAGAAVLSILYGLAGNSPIAIALGLDYLLVAVAAWAAGNLHSQRDITGQSTDTASSAAALRLAVQTQAVILGGAAAFVVLLAVVQLFQQALGSKPREDGGAPFGAACLAGAFVWLVLARSFESIRESNLLESRPLTFAFREAQWASLVAAAGLIGATFFPSLALWTGRILLIWIVAICAESLLRLVAAMLVPADASQAAVAPIRLLLRESLFTAANPLGSLFGTFEKQVGVSLRSSWAITFLKRAAWPLATLLILLSWGMTSLAIVETNQMAVREHFGRVGGVPLMPGLHVSLPWPMGRIRAFPVKTVYQVPIGFVEADQPVNSQQPRALLWTKPHAKEEFSLVLGGGTELVAVNAMVYFKIAEEPQEFLDYVYQQSTPTEALTAFAYRALMEETRGRTLDEVLSADRGDFARRLVESVRQQTQAARLGLEVVDLALLNLHPPIEAGGSYLDVINARLDAGRRVTEAEGERQVALLGAQTRGAMAEAIARAERSRRVSTALAEVAEFKALAEGLNDPRRTTRQRLWIEALESALANQRLFLVDRTLLDEGGELLLDTRRLETMRSSGFDVTSPDLPQGEPK